MWSLGNYLLRTTIFFFEHKAVLFTGAISPWNTTTNDERRGHVAGVGGKMMKKLQQEGFYSG